MTSQRATRVSLSIPTVRDSHDSIRLSTGRERKDPCSVALSRPAVRLERGRSFTDPLHLRIVSSTESEPPVRGPGCSQARRVHWASEVVRHWGEVCRLYTHDHERQQYRRAE